MPCWRGAWGLLSTGLGAGTVVQSVCAYRVGRGLTVLDAADDGAVCRVEGVIQDMLQRVRRCAAVARRFPFGWTRGIAGEDIP